jgi:Enoyl-(Acyl carrier protein) reductase
VKCDVSREEDARQLVEETIQSFGKLDVLFNNAPASTPPRAASWTWMFRTGGESSRSTWMASSGARATRSPNSGRRVGAGSSTPPAPVCSWLGRQRSLIRLQECCDVADPGHGDGPRRGEHQGQRNRAGFDLEPLGRELGATIRRPRDFEGDHPPYRPTRLPRRRCAGGGLLDPGRHGVRDRCSFLHRGRTDRAMNRLIEVRFSTWWRYAA